jgi:FKBP-type peptidyl-prolyl cis-trans isomerase
MIENRLTLISVFILVVIVGGAIFYKTQQPKPAEPEVAQSELLDVSTIPQEQLDTTELISETLTPGNGETAEIGDTVSMQYVGVLTNGFEFDSSYSRGTPFEFTIGKGGVIAGWDIGVNGMKVGEKRRLIIPADLGYGSSERGDIPANSTLVFDVVLEKVTKP